MSKGEESTIPAEGIKALSLEDEYIFNCIIFEPKEKEIEEKKSGNKTFSVMEKGLDYMIIPAEDNIVEIEGLKVYRQEEVIHNIEQELSDICSK